MNNSNYKIALVNEFDEIIGYEDKLKVHKLGLLHRAFSIFIFNDKNQLLLQKRAKTKYHSGSLWTNTCCSHMIENMHFEKYIHERLKYEMGFDTNLNFLFKFNYKIQLENYLFENEIDHVFTGIYCENPIINPIEADDFKWIDYYYLKKDIIKNPHQYTYWLKEALSRFPY